MYSHLIRSNISYLFTIPFIRSLIADMPGPRVQVKRMCKDAKDSKDTREKELERQRLIEEQRLKEELSRLPQTAQHGVRVCSGLSSLSITRLYSFSNRVSFSFSHSLFDKLDFNSLVLLVQVVQMEHKITGQVRKKILTGCLQIWFYGICNVINSLIRFED